MHTIPLRESGSFINGFSVVASLYSQLAGVLAGFAFAGLVALVSARISGIAPTATLPRSYAPLTSAFLGLFATSLNHAIVASDQSNSSRAASLELTAGVGFAVAGVMLVYSILILLHAVERDTIEPTGHAIRAVNLIEKSFVLGVCPLVVGVFASSIGDHARVKYGTNSGLSGVEVAGLTVFAATVVVCAILRQKKRRLITLILWVKSNETHYAPKELLSGAAVVISMLSVLVAAFTIEYSSPRVFVSDYIPLGELILVALFSVSAAVSALILEPAGERRKMTSLEAANAPLSASTN